MKNQNKNELKTAKNGECFSMETKQSYNRPMGGWLMICLKARETKITLIQTNIRLKTSFESEIHRFAIEKEKLNKNVQKHIPFKTNKLKPVILFK